MPPKSPDQLNHVLTDLKLFGILGLLSLGAILVYLGLNESNSRQTISEPPGFAFIVTDSPTFLASPDFYGTPTPVDTLDSPSVNGTTTAPKPEKSKKPKSKKENNCVSIGTAYPNAYRGWLGLGKPSRFEFRNIAGPDANYNPEQPDVRTSTDGLETVHDGDELCVVEK